MKHAEIEGGATLWARQTIDSEIFWNKPAEWFKIWFYIVNRVNWKTDKRFERGEIFLNYKWISDSTGATSNQIKHCVEYLKSATMIATRKTTRGFIIKVLNYDKYQTLDNYYYDIKSDTESHTERNTEGKQKENKSHTILKNEKNDKKDNNVTLCEQSSQTIKKLTFNQTDLDLTNLLIEEIKNNLPEFKEPNREVWASHFNKMIRLDNRTKEQAEYLIRWCQNNSFWQANILSPQKLREKWDRLVAQVKREKQENNSQTIRVI